MVLQKRRLSLVLAAAYGLTVTVSASFHDHRGVACRDCCGPADHADAPGRSSDTHEEHGDSGRPCSGGQATGGDGCSVCQFLAQKSLTAQQAESEGSTPLVSRAVLLPTVRTLAADMPLWRSRAPPSVS